LRYTFAQALPAPILSADKVVKLCGTSDCSESDHELFSLEITMKRIPYAGLVALLVASLGYAVPGSTISGAIAGRMALPSGRLLFGRKM